MNIIFQKKAAAIILFLFIVVPASVSADYETTVLSPDLEIRKLNEEVYVVTHKFPWAGNSMLVLIGENSLAFVDTPYTPEATNQVLDWIEKTLGKKKIIEINTGFHIDNLGGNKALIEKGIPVYGSDGTVKMLAERSEISRKLFLSWLKGPEKKRFRERYASIKFIPPDHIFPLAKGMILDIGGEKVEIIFPGETHSPDNVVVYFPAKKLLFGGCMILAGNKTGNTADANLNTWKKAVQTLKKLDVRIVVPGHGLRFDPGLIDNTVDVLP